MSENSLVAGNQRTYIATDLRLFYNSMEYANRKYDRPRTLSWWIMPRLSDRKRNEKRVRTESAGYRKPR